MSDEFDTLEEIAQMMTASTAGTAQARSAKARRAGRRYFRRVNVNGRIRSHDPVHRSAVGSCAPVSLAPIRAFDD